MADKLWSKKKSTPVRPLRVAREIMELISQILLRDGCYDSELGNVVVTVTDVKVSSSLQDAVIFVVPLNREKTDEILQYLNVKSPQFRSSLGHGLRLKYTPNIRFVLDKSFDYADRVERVLNELAKQDDATQSC